MNNDRLRELQKEWAKQKQEEEKEIEINPLSQYSTTQLKKRIKKEEGGKMIQTITKYICDYCKSEVSMTEYTQGTKIDIRVSLENPKGGAGQVAGQSMNICKKCSEELGIINSEKYHDYTYSQGRLRDTIGEIKTKIINIFYRRNQQEIHDIKILPQYFGDIEKGVKSFEVRKNDRNYKVGDTLLLREWVNGEYTGRDIERKVTYVLDDKSGYVLDGYVVMSIT